MSRVTREIDRGTRTVDGIEVQITELVWADEGRSFEVHRTDTGADLTEDGCFDTWPTDDQITDPRPLAVAGLAMPHLVAA